MCWKLGNNCLEKVKLEEKLKDDKKKLKKIK